MNHPPRIVTVSMAATTALLLLTVSGCSHYGIGVPLAPGLSLGLGLGPERGLSAGLRTGVGPVGFGVGMDQRGQVAANAGVGVGVGAGPVSTGLGVGKSVVLRDGEPRPAPVKTAQAVPAVRVKHVADAANKPLPAARVVRSAAPGTSGTPTTSAGSDAVQTLPVATPVAPATPIEMAGLQPALATPPGTSVNAVQVVPARLVSSGGAAAAASAPQGTPALLRVNYSPAAAAARAASGAPGSPAAP